MTNGEKKKNYKKNSLFHFKSKYGN
jgi:hypothetical protein